MNDFNIENVRFMCIRHEPKSIVILSFISYFNKHLDESTILRLK